MKPRYKELKLIIAFAIMLCAAGLFGMGSQGVLYESAGDLVDKMIAWQKDCGGKPGDEDCERNLYALRETAYKAAVFPADIAISDPDDKSPDGEARRTNTGEVYGKPGWKDSWQLYVKLFIYHGDCFNRYDLAGCKAEWSALEKAQKRHRRLYGEEPRWADFPDALKGRVFKPTPSPY